MMILLVSCNKAHWSTIDQQNFLNDCVQAYKGEEPERVCECILNCIENEFENYEKAIQKILIHTPIQIEECAQEC